MFTLARLFNEHISLIIDRSIQSFNCEELNALLLASTGSQIDGAWRNAIGEEAEKVVQRLLVKEAVKRDLLIAFIPRVGTAIKSFEEAHKDAIDVKTILVASCFTEEMKKRISSDKGNIDKFFSLTQIIKEKETYG